MRADEAAQSGAGLVEGVVADDFGDLGGCHVVEAAVGVAAGEAWLLHAALVQDGPYRLVIGEERPLSCIVITLPDTWARV